MPTVSDRLIAVRGSRSRRSLADELGAKESTLRNYEQGVTLPTSDFLETLCKKLRISPRWLLLGEGPMEASEGTSAPASAEEKEQELRRRIGELEADKLRLEIELYAEKKITSVYQETLEALKAFALKGESGITNMPASAPSPFNKLDQ